MTTEINKRTQCGWNNWRKMSGILCDNRVPPTRAKGKIHKSIFQPAVTINEHLSWKPHIDKICSKIYILVGSIS